MRKSLFFILVSMLMLLFVQAIIAQAPQGLNYQAVARNASGALLDNQAITVRLKIHQSSASGTLVYAETHTKTTNSLGLFTLTIGQGTVTAPITSFASIDWNTGNYWLQVELKIGSGSYTDMGTSQLLSVPYAFFADEAKKLSLPGTAGQTLRHSGTNWVASTNLNNNGSEVGIGTTTPDAKLEILSNSTIVKPQLKLYENEGDDYARLTLQNTSGSTFWTLAGFNHATNANERFNIYNSVSGDVFSISGAGFAAFNHEPDANRRLYVEGETKGAGYFTNNSISYFTLYAKNLGSGAAGYFENNGNSANSYALYAKNQGTGPAAYIDGTLQVSGGNTSEINRSQTGTANIVPVCYGSVEASGTKNTGGSTVNFTVTKVVTGIYDIAISSETYAQTTHCAVASLGDPGFINTMAFFGKLRVSTYNISGTLTDKEFSFVIFRP